MTFQVVLTDRAIRDLDEAYLWYAQRSPEAAARWYNGFMEAFKGLSKNPERLALATESLKCHVDVRQLLYGRRRTYRAFFLIREQTVVILHIRHTARHNPEPDNLEE